MKRFFKRSFFILLALSYMSIIWIQSSLFNPERLVSVSSSLSQSYFLIIGASLEFAHLFQFGLLYLFIIFVFLSFGRLRTVQEATALVIALVYGIVDEIHQLYVPFRSFTVIDLLKDGIGVLAFWWVINHNYFKKKNSRVGQWLRNVNNVS